MDTWYYDLDHGAGGDGTVQADDSDEALTLACEDALDGDWGDEACTVRVRVWRIDEDGDEIDEAETTAEIPSAEERKLADGEVLHEDEDEFRTDRLVRVDDEFFLVHANGGWRGAHSSGGNQFPATLADTEDLSRTDARRWLLGRGLDPAEVARLTRDS